MVHVRLLPAICGLAVSTGVTGILIASQTKAVSSPAARPSQTASAQATDKAKGRASDGIVGVYIESVARQININDLRKKYPGTTAARVDPAALRADAIVGWYDKGNSFHEQKMEKGLGHDFGGLKIIQPVLRGQAVR
jgi:hypothetical protein